jgi:hypothetical protein
MSIERELLKEALVMLQSIGEEDLMMRIDAELKKPEPEPICFLSNSYRLGMDDCEYFVSSNWDKKAFPVYTSPPARHPLSDEEIRKVINWEKDGITNARAIEKAHGIGDL